MNAKNACGALILVMAVLALAVASPASAATEPLAVPAPAVTAPAQPGCGMGPELSLTTPGQGETCPAARPESTTPDFLVNPELARGRTCRCSCGFPCQTDADCGGGVGSCRAGISCC
jgi:hypothetical protein